MALHPDIQKRAQADVDQVAQGRLPTLDDYESLPFIKAIIREVLRWAPVAPLGLCLFTNMNKDYELTSLNRHSTSRDGRRCVPELFHPERSEDCCKHLVRLVYFPYKIILI